MNKSQITNKQTKTNKTWFVLGRDPKISAAEIAAVLGINTKNLEINGEEILITDMPIPPNIINKLGGTIKIADQISDGLSITELKNTIVEQLSNATGKIKFGISYHGPSKKFDTEATAKEIKKTLKNQGRSVRYIKAGENNKISSATIFHNNLTTSGNEFLIIPTAGQFALAKTTAIQPLEEFSQRDFGRPGRDDRSGMLPPKLAMIMINLSQTKPETTLLDPFCGSGTILTEAMLMGYKHLVGTDISKKAVADTQKNIEWINKISDFRFTNSNLRIECCDINNIGSIIPNNSIDTVVTEPYLGKPLTGHEDEKELKIQINELKLLYLNAFKAFSKIVKGGGIIIFIIPRFFYHNEWLTINCEAEINKLGFQTIPFQQKKPYLLYGRPGQLVGREIWKLKRV